MSGLATGDRVINRETGQVGTVNDPSYLWRGQTTVLVELPDEEWMIPWSPELVERGEAA